MDVETEGGIGEGDIDLVVVSAPESGSVLARPVLENKALSENQRRLGRWSRA